MPGSAGTAHKYQSAIEAVAVIGVITMQLTKFSDYANRNDDTEPPDLIGADGARRGGCADVPGDVGVADGVAERNPEQRLPHANLKVRADQDQAHAPGPAALGPEDAAGVGQGFFRCRHVGGPRPAPP